MRRACRIMMSSSIARRFVRSGLLIKVTDQLVAYRIMLELVKIFDF